MENQGVEKRFSIMSALDMHIDKTSKTTEEITGSIDSILEKANKVFLLLDRLQKTRSSSNTALLTISPTLRKGVLEMLEHFPNLQNSDSLKSLEDCADVEEVRLRGSKLAHRTRVLLMSLDGVCSKFHASQVDLNETPNRPLSDSFEE